MNGKPDRPDRPSTSARFPFRIGEGPDAPEDALLVITTCPTCRQVIVPGSVMIVPGPGQPGSAV